MSITIWKDPVSLGIEGETEGDTFELGADQKPDNVAVSQRFQLENIYYRLLPDMQIVSVCYHVQSFPYSHTIIL